MSGDAKTVGFVPVRSGSKRLPRKNMAFIEGRPAFEYAIRTLQGVSGISSVWVSSDDEMVLQRATEMGATAHRRDPKLAGDTVGVLQVVRSELNLMGDVQAVAVLYATAVLVRSESISVMLKLASDDCWMHPVVASTGFSQPVAQSLVAIDDNLWVPLLPKLANARSQDVPEIRVDAGGVYVWPAEFLRRSTGVYDEPQLTYPIGSDEILDVDERSDLDELIRRVQMRGDLG